MWHQDHEQLNDVTKERASVLGGFLGVAQVPRVRSPMVDYAVTARVENFAIKGRDSVSMADLPQHVARFVPVIGG